MLDSFMLHFNFIWDEWLSSVIFVIFISATWFIKKSARISTEKECRRFLNLCKYEATSVYKANLFHHFYWFKLFFSSAVYPFSKMKHWYMHTSKYPNISWNLFAYSFASGSRVLAWLSTKFPFTSSPRLSFVTYVSGIILDLSARRMNHFGKGDDPEMKNFSQIFLVTSIKMWVLEIHLGYFLLHAFKTAPPPPPWSHFVFRTPWLSLLAASEWDLSKHLLIR